MPGPSPSDEDQTEIPVRRGHEDGPGSLHGREGRRPGAETRSHRNARVRLRRQIHQGRPDSRYHVQQGRPPLLGAPVRPRLSRVHQHEQGPDGPPPGACDVLRAHDVPAAGAHHRHGSSRRSRNRNARHPRREGHQPGEHKHRHRAPVLLAQALRGTPGRQHLLLPLRKKEA